MCNMCSEIKSVDEELPANMEVAPYVSNLFFQHVKILEVGLASNDIYSYGMKVLLN
jgi:hypothetical protein